METSRSEEDELQLVQAVAVALLLKNSAGGGRWGRLRQVRVIETEAAEETDCGARTIID